MFKHSDIVKAAAPVEAIALRRNVSIHTVRSWIQRNSIPAEHWLGFVSDGWATFDELAKAAAARKGVPAPAQSARAGILSTGTDALKAGTNRAV